METIRPDGRLAIKGADCQGFYLPNVWLGTSVEDQDTANARIPFLLETPAAVRFISAEPLIGPVDLTDLRPYKHPQKGDPNALTGRCIWPNAKGYEDSMYATSEYTGKLDWVIVGGESGRNARPMEADWAREIMWECEAHEVAFFMKQMARKAPIPDDLLIREMPRTR